LVLLKTRPQQKLFFGGRHYLNDTREAESSIPKNQCLGATYTPQRLGGATRGLLPKPKGWSAKIARIS